MNSAEPKVVLKVPLVVCVAHNAFMVYLRRNQLTIHVLMPCCMSSKASIDVHTLNIDDPIIALQLGFLLPFPEPEKTRANKQKCLCLNISG